MYKSIFQDKRTLERKVLILFPPEEIINKTIRKMVHEVANAESVLNEKISFSIDKLNTMTENVFPRIKIYFRRIPGENKDLGSYINYLKKKDTIRCVIFFNDVRHQINDDTLRECNISHLILVDPKGKEQGWVNTNGPYSVKVVTPATNAANLIHDVALDITTFYSWPVLKDNVEDSVSHRFDFSFKKVQYAIKNKLNSYYGPIKDDKIGYFSFAASCRKVDSFNYEQYLKVWHDFISTLSSGEHKTVKEVSLAGKEKIVDEITKYHNKRGMLNRKRILSELIKLDKGSYLLVITNRKPKTIAVRNRILLLMRRKKWRTNIIRIIPFGKKTSYIQYNSYLVFYKFVVR